MRIQLSDHFTYKRLFRFVLSPILMMVCASFYSIVDGFFVSNYVGKTPFAAVNLIMPVMMGVGSLGYMVGSGGSAIISKTLGEGKQELANQYFSMLVYITAAVGFCLSILGIIFIRPIAVFLGAEGELLENCVIYGRILFAAEVVFILQNAFQTLLVTAEKPELSLKISLSAGLTNIVLDYLFIMVFEWGIAGAAIATACGQLIGGLVPILYFSRKNNSLLQLTQTHFYKKILLKTCTNGSSEMVANLSASIVSMLYNFQLMKFAGENGVAAYGVIMYVNFIFTAIFFGYSIGSAPLIGYHYGANNIDELKNLFKKSLKLLGTTGIILTSLAELFAVPLVNLFASYDVEFFNLTLHGFRIFCLAFIFMGINVWGSALFTALSNGLISAVISFVRTLVFELLTVLILPIFLDVDGIWMSVLVAELCALVMTTLFFVKKRKQYQYY